MAISILNKIGFWKKTLRPNGDKEALLRHALWTQSSNGIFLSNPSGDYIEANTAALDLVGYTKEELLQLNLGDLVPPDERTELPNRQARLQKEGQRTVIRDLLHKNGTLLPVEINAMALPDGSMLGIVRDMSDRVRAEEHTARLDRLFRTNLEIDRLIVRRPLGGELLQPACEILVDLGGYRLVWAAKGCTESGTVRRIAEAGPALPYLDGLQVRCDDTPSGQGPTGKVIREGGYVLNNQAAASPAYTPWRERAQEHKLQASAAFALQFADGAPGALNVYSEDIDAFTGEDVDLLQHLTDNLGFALKAAYIGLQRQEAERQLRETTERLESSVRDRSQMEADLLISRRMAAVGTLAAGVAHEINNPLTFVSGNIETALDLLLQPEVSPEERTRLQAMLQDALDGANRVQAIVRDMNTFSRTDSAHKELVAVGSILESAITMANKEIELRTSLVRHFQDVPLVCASPGRLGQVFLNLLMNAVQATPVGHRHNRSITLSIFKRNAHVVIAIKDQGAGISPENIDRIFDPFFTTKTLGEGMGLGLSICHSIITEQSGQLLVQSTPGSGSKFEVILPIAKRISDATSIELPSTPNPASAAPQQVRASTEMPRAERILIIDDEKAVTTMFMHILADHRVDCANDVNTALSLCHDQDYDLIFCDLMMPDITGMEFYRRLLKKSPAMSADIVFMTGGAFTAEARAFLDASEHPCLQKPFRVADVRTILENRARARKNGSSI